jgi:iron complex outermembrane receptor protein
MNTQLLRVARSSRRFASLLVPGLQIASAHAAVDAGLADLSLEQLTHIRVTSVTGRPVLARDSAASVFVITAEDIRRSAATSLPEALRLAPNLQVARLNAGQYAISARGSNNATGNKLLVLIDGRTVYSPLFSGVFWDAQDLLLQDIERIEVISGPGATLWGANAVNGVINVITRTAGTTQGGLVAASGGRDGSTGLARFGGRLGDEGRYRVYAMRLNRNNTSRLDGVERPDASSKDQVGFRADWQGSAEQLTFQGDAYSGGTDASSNLAPRLSGANLLARWRRESGDGSNWELQAYYDRAQRDDDVLFRDKTQTLDIQFNHVPVTARDHRLIWGAGYRHASSDAGKTLFVLFSPARRELSWANVFVQDEVRLSDPWRVTAGIKLERNSYTGLEVLPTLRTTYSFGESRLLWASLSRAVRAPSRIDREFFLPSSPPFAIRGNPDFQSEVANVVELGYRAQPLPSIDYAVTAFHHQYGRLRGGTVSPTLIENRTAGAVEGLEAWGKFAVNPRWRLSAGLVELRKSLRGAPGSSPTSVSDLGNDPAHQWSLRSSIDLPGRVEFDLALRHVSSLPAPVVAAYTATDLRLAWQASPAVTVSLLVQNLLDPGHIEFNAASAASQIPRSAFLVVEWRGQ